MVPQVDGPFDERLAAAWADVDGPALQIGMDTPQVTPQRLQAAASALVDSDAVLGPAADGGWWLLGLHQNHPNLFAGIEMSAADTGRQQLARLRSLGLDVTTTELLIDVDTIEDAHVVAAAAPETRFAHMLSAMELT